ncbi:MAG: hypothetical protein INR72_18000 [Williamsia herbipolensis]|nr:hypothetical protein [Williamsia herbipolensis]
MRAPRALPALLVVLTAGACSTGAIAQVQTTTATLTVTAAPVTVTVTASAPAPTSSAPINSAPTSSAASTSTDGSSSGGIPARADACALLTRAEAETLAARRLQEAMPSGVEFGTPTYCNFPGYPDDPGIGQVEVTVGDGAYKNLQIDRDTLAHDFTEVTGVGDECWAEDGQIFFSKGSTWASVRVVLLDEDPEKADRLLAAAKLVVGRLP